MNGTMGMQDFSSANRNHNEKVTEANTMDLRMSFSEALSRNTAAEVRKPPQQKFKSRNFPEPFWGHDD